MNAVAGWAPRAIRPLHRPLALAAALGLVGACGRERPPAPASGKVRISTRAKVSIAAHRDDPDPSQDICAGFTLTPYSFDAAHKPVPAGAPVRFATTSDSTATEQLLGCVAGGDHYDYAPSASSPYAEGRYNWAYLVSATRFEFCNHGAVPSHRLDPNTANPAPAYFAPVHCEPALDAALSIDYPVALSSTSLTQKADGGVAISAGADPTTQYVGCKQAELVDGGSGAGLRFAQSNAIDTKTAVPLGLVGYTTTATLADAALAQYGGQTWTANPNGLGATMFNTYYTGQFTAGAAALPSAILQTFLASADESHLFNDPAGDALCPAGEWVDSRHALCLTTGADTLSPGSIRTVGKLADAFLYLPGTGYAAASVNRGGGSISLQAQMTANSADDYTSSGSRHPIVTANAAPGFASTLAAPASGGGFNDRMMTPTVPAPAGLTFTGLYIDPSALGQFLVGGSQTTADVTINAWATLSWNATSTTWELSVFSDLAHGIPPGFGEQRSGCVTSPGRSFFSTGADQTFTVPAGVTSLHVKAWGAGGGGSSGGAGYTFANDGGGGGFASGILAVTPGDLLTVIVGRGGKGSDHAGSAYGGGTGAGGYQGGGGGGGRSSVRLVNGAEVITAGAGGGGGYGNVASAPAAGGGSSGGTGGSAYDGLGGTQSAGGAHGPIGSNLGADGTQDQGGVAGAYCGGGGGGHFGGGGGSLSSGVEAGAGGGGSSYTGGVTAGQVQAGSGSTAANTVDPIHAGALGSGGPAGAAGGWGSGNDGQDGEVYLGFGSGP